MRRLGLLPLLLLLPGRPAPAAEPSPRLRYDFAAAAGDRVADSSGHGHEGRLEGKDGALAVLVPTPYGRALRLEAGKGQGLRLPAAADLLCAEALTVMAWVRPDAVDAHLAVVANKGDQVPGQPAQGYRLSVAWGRLLAELGFGDDEVGVRLLSPEWSVEPGCWAHLAMTFDGQDLVIYVNATEAGRLHLPAPRRLAPGPASGCTIGKYYWNDAYPFAGLLADVRIYDRALSAPEVFSAACVFLEGT